MSRDKNFGLQLLPCPMCRSPASVLQGTSGHWIVQCDNIEECGVSLEEAAGFRSDVCVNIQARHQAYREILAARWNRREV